MLLRGGSPVLSETAVEEMTSDQLTAEQKERDGTACSSAAAGRSVSR